MRSRRARCDAVALGVPVTLKGMGAIGVAATTLFRFQSCLNRVVLG